MKNIKTYQKLIIFSNIIVGIMIVMLMYSNHIVINNQSTEMIVEPFMQSNLTEEMTNNTVMLDSHSVEIINTRYMNENNEFGYCLESDENGVLSITKTFTRLYSKESVTFSCRKDIKVRIHSHPGGSCYFSYQDVANMVKRNDTFAIVICGNNTFHAINSTYDVVNVNIVGEEKNEN